MKILKQKVNNFFQGQAANCCHRFVSFSPQLKIWLTSLNLASLLVNNHHYIFPVGGWALFLKLTVPIHTHTHTHRHSNQHPTICVLPASFKSAFQKLAFKRPRVFFQILARINLDICLSLPWTWKKRINLESYKTEICWANEDPFPLTACGLGNDCRSSICIVWEAFSMSTLNNLI